MQKEIKDSELSKLAKKKATFKYHVLIYFIMNILFWTMWYISLKNNSTPPPTKINTIPWPVWPMVGWGVIVVIHYFTASRINYSDIEK
jgi:hypothetical protein